MFQLDETFYYYVLRHFLAPELYVALRPYPFTRRFPPDPKRNVPAWRLGMGSETKRN
jgi:hypothetical protein